MELEQFSKVRLDKNCRVQMCKAEMIQRRLAAVIATKGLYQFSHHIRIYNYATALLCIILSVITHLKPLAHGSNDCV